jgi:hypothetical protein
VTAFVTTFESCALITPPSISASALVLYMFKTEVLTSWQILMRHIVISRKSATLLHDSENIRKKRFISEFLDVKF